jgi:hypothetical protein
LGTPAPSAAASSSSPVPSSSSALAESGRRALMEPSPVSELIAYRLEGGRFKYHLPESVEKHALQNLPPSDRRTKQSVAWQTTQKDLGFLPDSSLRPRGPTGGDGKFHGLDGRFTETMVKIGFGRASNFMRVHKTSHCFLNHNQGPAAWDTHRAH